MQKLRDLMTVGSQIRYILWRAFRLPVSIMIELISGERMKLRPKPADDIQTVFEIFVIEVYKPPIAVEADSVHQIVDLGANVGFSGIYFASKYPNARIIAFEPHPHHVQLATSNLALNGLNQRVDLVCAAAANRTEDAFLTDEGVCSTVINESLDGSISIKLVDIFDLLKGKAIDILKIDIEGGEFILLEDRRFGKIQARIIALEYHVLPDKPDALNWCEQKLAEFGYQTKAGAWNNSSNGFIWAYRDVATI